MVCVTHESSDVVGDLLASVAGRCPVVIVDNAASDVATIAELADRFGAQFIANERNIGFGAACNQGSAVTSTEFVFFVNPDARLAEGTLDGMLAAFDRYAGCVAASPRLVDERGRSVFKGRSVLLPRSQWIKEPLHDSVVPVLSGAALWVRREAFEACGGFDRHIFLYHEDDDLSIRLRKAGAELRYVRDALVVHAGGIGSTRSVEIAQRKGWWMGRSRIYAARKHKVPFAAPLAITAAMVQFLNPGLLWSPAKRAKQRAFLRGLVSEAFHAMEEPTTERAVP
ncbi:glycosyltransferase family 2 protein [Aquibium carbonis]|uniref:Glycosyltransferase family 2 protein n=1 Tax=Aquibium carbonis TaxID=2495581 RepID=A0A429YY21_9HYPH|nr:glycosyltransferase family 2 protein [Aquibium carbonis]